MTDKFYSSLQIPNNANMPGWLQALSQSLPELLLMLVHENQPPSFERMQLINMELVIVDANNEPGSLSWSNQELVKKPDQLLSLSGVLQSNGQPMLNVSITYFLRGQRRVFRHPAPPHLGNEKSLQAITADQVDLFCTALNQSNDFFTDSTIAELMGHARPLVPTHMAIALLISQTLLTNPMFKKFSLSFYRAIPQQEPLIVTEEHDAHVYTFGLGTAEGMAMVNEASLLPMH